MNKLISLISACFLLILFSCSKEPEPPSREMQIEACDFFNSEGTVTVNNMSLTNFGIFTTTDESSEEITEIDIDACVDSNYYNLWFKQVDEDIPLKDGVYDLIDNFNDPFFDTGNEMKVGLWIRTTGNLSNYTDAIGTVEIKGNTMTFDLEFGLPILGVVANAKGTIEKLQ